MDRRAALSWIAVFILMAVGGWLRLGMLDDAYSPDEFANIVYGSVWRILTDPESGVNPPLLRLLNAPFGEAGALVAGRWVSWTAGTATIGLAFALGRAASGGSTFAGLLAAALVTFNPEAVKMSGRFRSYGLLMAVASWHALAVGAWMRAQADGLGDEVRAQARQVRASAILLPWIHYALIPVMLLLGLAGLFVPRMRRLVTLYVPAAVLVAPMGVLVFTDTSARVPQSTGLMELFVQVASLQYYGPLLFGPRLASLGVREPQYALATAVVALALVASALLWSRATDTARFLTLAAWALLLSLMALSGVQLVRSPTATLLLVWVAPLIGALPMRIPNPYLRVLVAGAVAAALGAFLVTIDKDRLERMRAYTTYDNVRAFAQHWHDLDEVRGDLPIYTWPSYTHVGLYFYLYGGHVRREPWPPLAPCPEDDGCWAIDDTAFFATSSWPTATPAPGLYVAFTRTPGPLPPPCTELPARDGWTAWRCPASTAEAP